jgi:hypothetical protein
MTTPDDNPDDITDDNRKVIQRQGQMTTKIHFIWAVIWCCHDGCIREAIKILDIAGSW